MNERKAAGFPCGLSQPEGSFRFSADALLLSAFLKPSSKETRLADLGTGCGVVALGLLLRNSHLAAVGIEREGVLVEAAEENARRLGVDSRFIVVREDLARVAAGDVPETVRRSAGETWRAGSCDIVLANPPYRTRGQGREPKSPLRRGALFDDKALDVFCEAGARLLKQRGRFGIIFPAARLSDLCAALLRSGLVLQRILPVYSKKGDSASVVMVEARRGVRSGMIIEPPLVLHLGTGGATKISPAALAFCPELQILAQKKYHIPK